MFDPDLWKNKVLILYPVMDGRADCQNAITPIEGITPLKSQLRWFGIIVAWLVYIIIIPSNGDVQLRPLIKTSTGTLSMLASQVLRSVEGVEPIYEP